MQKEIFVPPGTIETLAPGLFRAVHEPNQSSIVPSGTGGLLNANPALRTGLFSLGPSGTSRPKSQDFHQKRASNRLEKPWILVFSIDTRLMGLEEFLLL
jgi:hypothetical protein